MRLEPCDSTHLTVTASSVVSDRPCIVQAVILTPAAAASEVILYDALTSVATKIKVDVKAAASTSSVVVPISGSGIVFSTGCTAVVTGTGAVAQVVFAKI